MRSVSSNTQTPRPGLKKKEAHRGFFFFLTNLSSGIRTSDETLSQFLIRFFIKFKGYVCQILCYQGFDLQTFFEEVISLAISFLIIELENNTSKSEVNASHATNGKNELY